MFRPNRNPEAGPSFRSYRCGDGEMLFLATLVAPLFIKALDVLDAFEVMLIEGVDGEFLHLFQPASAGRQLACWRRSSPADRGSTGSNGSRPPACRRKRSGTLTLAGEPSVRGGSGAYRFEHPVVGPVDTPRPSGALRASAPTGGDPRWAGRPVLIVRAGPGPLAGLRVIDLANFLAGPFGPTVLAFWGADVVKVETPDGDPYRLYTSRIWR